MTLWSWLEEKCYVNRQGLNSGKHPLSGVTLRHGQLVFVFEF